MTLLLSLPDDIWFLIFNLLSNEDITSLLRTCKFFSQIKISNYFLLIHDYSKLFFNSIRYKKATSLEFRKININEIINNKRNLISKDLIEVISGDKKFIFPDNLLSLKLDSSCIFFHRHYPKTLKMLHITFSSINHFNNYCYDQLENLEDLRLIYNLHNNTKKYGEEEYIIILPLPKLPLSLKSLVCHNIELSDNLPENLKELYLSGSVGDEICYNRKLFKNLIRLKLFDIYYKDRDFVIDMLKYAINLYELDITYYGFYEKTYLNNNIKKLKIYVNDNQKLINIDFSNIKHLIINNYSHRYFNNDEMIINAENLTHLSLKGLIKLKKEQLNMPKLEKIIYGKRFEGDKIIL